MKIRRSALLVLVALTVVACEGPSGDTTIGYTGVSADCLANATAMGPEHARDVFPDNPDVAWATTARGMTSQGYADVELTPTPAEVGYSSFRFYSSCNGDVVTLLAGFVPGNDGWELLFTTEDGEGIDLEPPTV